MVKVSEESSSDGYPKMKLDCFILIDASSDDLHPIVSGGFSRVELPFLNRPLLNRTIDYASPYAGQFFIFCPPALLSRVHSLIREYDCPIELVPSEASSGSMSSCFEYIRKRMVREGFIFCHADLFYYGEFDPIIEYFTESSSDLLGFFYTSTDHSEMTCISKEGDLLAYNTDVVPSIPNNASIVMSVELKLMNFFICRASILELVPEDPIDFKTGVIPLLIENRRRVKVISMSHLPVTCMRNYRKQLEIGKSLFDSKLAMLIDKDSSIEQGSDISDTVIGSGSVIEEHCKINQCIIMRNVVIGRGCALYNCIIGEGAVIPENTKMVNCIVAPFYVLKEPGSKANCNFSAEQETHG